MTAAAQKDWQKDFGLDDWKPPHFFSSVDQLDDAAGNVPQAHALRRAFEQLGIDGVLCQERSPVVYFRQVTKIDAAGIINLHRSFWNQGIAPILVIIAPDEVHVYSGLIPPADTLTESGQAPGFVETLNRVQDQLRSFLLSVESGEYFHVHRHSFDPRKRVDRDLLRNLQAARQELGQVQAARLEPQTLDALLCRLVFTCYLFDRGIIDRAYLKTLRIHGAKHLKDILAKKPRTDAKADLYKLFEQLGNDFNGDLFSAELQAESRQVRVEHLEILDRFFHGTDVRSGQQAFWPYDFGFIPIETISAIYERFLKAAGEEQQREAGAFYTPRFLAEFVLDVALEGETSLLEKRFLDPACGSGIFLVGLFNRLAEEWKLKNPGARYDRRANGLMDVLRTNLRGVDSNRSACQITAFSLYLALLDQLSPPGIRQFFGKLGKLPYLISAPGETSTTPPGETIRCADFFTEAAQLPQTAHIIVGNPPWGSAKDRNTPAVRWCAERNLQHPDRQMATAFIWKAPTHLEDGGKVCFVLPHGTLFNHNDTAVRFQQSLFRFYAVDRVANLTDYQRFLFEESEAPAIVMRYGGAAPSNNAHRIDYWSPKFDWRAAQAEVLNIAPQDRDRLTIREVLNSLTGEHTPLVWKLRHWATPRDLRLLDRLSLMPPLSEHVRQPREQAPTKTWLLAEGCQPVGPSDDPDKATDLPLPSRLFLQAKSTAIQFVLCEADCETLPKPVLRVRSGSNKITDVFRAPHVLINHGFTKIAFATFPVAFFDSIRAIQGPEKDKELLAFLTAYLRSPLAKYFQFHTSSSWGVGKQVVDSIDLLRTPFPKPDQLGNPRRGWEIVREVAAAVTKAAKEVSSDFADRDGIVQRAQESVGKLIEEYFDIDDIERMLIADTAKIIIPSVRPSRGKPNVPTVKQGDDTLRASYTKLLCDRLNGWAKQEYKVHGKTVADPSIGVGMVVLEKTRREERPAQLSATDRELLKAIDSLQRTAAKGHGTFELVRGVKVFHKNLLYITKPLGQRFWTNTAALNDADEIAATILTRSAREGA
jgi:hypothetical protein